MAPILVATDFSPAATSAVHYACKLAADKHASVTIVHTFVVPIAFNDTPMPALPLDEARQIADDNMAGLMCELQDTYTGLQIDKHVAYGDITDVLEEYTEQIAPWVIVIGNSTDEDTEFWLGSNLLNVLRDLPYSVIAVPPGVEYKPLKKICLACDEHDLNDDAAIAPVANLLGDGNVALHIVNVGTEAASNNAEAASLIAARYGGTYHYLQSDNIDEAIHAFATDNQMDWLLVIPHKHTFFERLFNKSHTKAIARITHIPLVALHKA